jgi:hypothetical protein
MGEAVTSCRFCHAATEHIGHLAACPVVRAWFASFLALVGIFRSPPSPSFSLPSHPPGTAASVTLPSSLGAASFSYFIPTPPSFPTPLPTRSPKSPSPDSLTSA